MRHSWMVYVISMYLIILYFGGIAEMQNMVDSGQMANINQLLRPTIVNFSLGAFIQLVGSYIVILLQSLFLYFPTVWSGNWYWFYFFFCIPVVITTFYAIIAMLRGYGTAS